VLEKMNMRSASIAASSKTLMHPRTPGLILLARDLKILIARLTRRAKKLYKH
jgi:hypothetical protein